MSEKKVIETIDLKMTYKAGKVAVHALRGVDLVVEQGEFVAIMGPSGCGKSTLLHILGCMLKPSSGKVVIDGEDVSNMSEQERTEVRRRKIGFVFQKFNLFPTLTAEGNIRLAERIRKNGRLPDSGGVSMSEILKLLNLEGRLHHKPAEMSGGEQQRVAIARALVNHPAIVLADEPTGNLDSEHSQIVLNMFKQLNEKFGQTILMITHSEEAASVASRILRMRDGRILQ
ncbi:MAG: ABC transporter ATP-binding protein [Acidobacteriota bacterium]|nr:ABC transporter ATP-binding protein [Blastocatellia bacterium]MDW8412338.1 ABC transporter ATP-binding protein [Acidobacteriota bacterium]